MTIKDQLRNGLRADLGHLWAGLKPDLPLRPPEFPGCNKAAERLRRLQIYQQASVIAVMADPVLLQARINALQDGKTLIAATPGLKQGLVRITPQKVPLPRRSLELRGGALFKAGLPLRLPQARIKKIDLILATALAANNDGILLGDGRGLLDLLHAVLREIKAIAPQTPVAVLISQEQLLASDLPKDAWDVGADIIITPSQTYAVKQPLRPALSLAGLPPRLLALPPAKALLNSPSEITAK